jgi:hypothetical protein
MRLAGDAQKLPAQFMLKERWIVPKGVRGFTVCAGHLYVCDGKFVICTTCPGHKWYIEHFVQWENYFRERGLDIFVSKSKLNLPKWW